MQAIRPDCHTFKLNLPNDPKRQMGVGMGTSAVFHSRITVRDGRDRFGYYVQKAWY